MKIRFLAVAACALSVVAICAQGTYQLAVMKYNGGGDWYANPTAVPNLVKFCNEQLGMNINTDVPNVDVGSPDIFTYPWLDAPAMATSPSAHRRRKTCAITSLAAASCT